jgi:2-C-methyl-D-erythritol 4-phosphate cytidylyltransferase
MSAELPKQYLKLCGRTLLENSLHPFLNCARLTGVVVVIAPGDSRWQDLACARERQVRTAYGGPERMHSVLNGLRALAREARPDDWVLVHDAARPCLDRDDLERLIATLEHDPVGGILAVPVGDTLKRAAPDAEHVGATVDRAGLWAAQTPQMFRFALLERALSVAVESGHPVTDEAAAVEALGQRPCLVEGSVRNIKVTRAVDLKLAEAILTTMADRA